MVVFKILTLFLAISAFPLTNIFNQGPVSGWDAWWFMGGDEAHVIPSATSDGIMNQVDGYDTVGDDAWRYSSKLPNCQSVSVASFVTNSFTISGDHEISFAFGIDCVDNDGNLNYTSKNGGSDIDIFVYNSADNQQLCSLRIWYDSGGYANGNHSYHLGVGNNYPGSYVGMNWINGDAQLKSQFYLNFSKKYLFRSYVNKDYSKLVRLDNNSNSFYNDGISYLNDVDNIYFLIKGNGGWQKTATIVLKEINGQSLQSNDGIIIDDISPDIFVSGEFPNNIEVNQPFTIPVTAVDVLSTPIVKYYFDGVLLSNNTVTPSSSGSHTIKVTATDSSNNISEKEFSINVTAKIEPPVITELPQIEDQRIAVGSNFSCDLPKYTDNSGVASVNATIEYLDAQSNPILLTYDLITNKFIKQIDNSFISGRYEVVYTITNPAGSTISNPIIFNLEIYKIPTIDYVTFDEGITVKYVPEGILIHSIGRWRKTSFGTFDIRQGIDAYFTIPIYSENGGKNTASYFDMKITNKENSDYWIMYRIWLNEEFLTNDSSPTNMYFNFGTPGNEQCVDVGDCGWLTRTVDGVDGRFHFNYNTNDGFQGEFRDVLQPAKGVQSHTSRFFDESGSNNFIVEFYVASRDGGVGDDQNSEFIMNELNEQNFANTDGVLDMYARPKIVVGTVNKTYLANSNCNVNIYVKDILNLNPIIFVRFSDLEKNVIREDSFVGDMITLNIPDIGFYKLKIFVKNVLDKEIGVTFDIEARSSITPVDVNVEGSYPSTFEKNQSVTVLKANYSDNVDYSKNKITLKYMQEENEVMVGDVINFTKAGMYTLTYYACDNARPNVNETFKRFYFNVLDYEKPLVDVKIDSTFRAFEEVRINVSVIDDTECDIAIIINDTNGYKTIYNSNEVKFIPEIMGKYNISVRVEDAYNNVTIFDKTIEIGKKAPNQTLISWVVIGCVVVGLLGAFVGLTISSKIKENRGRVE